MKVLTLQSGRWNYEIHMLNPGDHFPNFGGSRHDLFVRKTASLIVRSKSPMTLEDKEHDIHDPVIWQWIARLINNQSGDVIADAGEDAGAYAEYVAAKGDIDEEPLSIEDWRELNNA